MIYRLSRILLRTKTMTRCSLFLSTEPLIPQKINKSDKKIEPLFPQNTLDNKTEPLFPQNINKKDDKKLLRELCAKIRFTGPIPVAEYMREVATNPLHGFYTSQQDSLGKEGHFITSPEISQMFGESLAVWYINEWMKMGEPKKFQMIELGPGNGTLMNDILRTFSKIRPRMLEGVSVSLVEVSERLKKKQQMVLCGNNNLTSWGCPINWYSSLRDVPKQFSFFLAHEFMDALPVHIFQRTSEGWREVLVDIDPSQGENIALRFVISRHATPSCILLENIDGISGVDRLELSPQSGLMVKDISRRVGEQGGAALIADYGDVSGDRDTLRAYRNHKQVDPLDNPGTSDITADVDFHYLNTQVDENCVMFGPVEQCEFLHACGIGTRCNQLLESSKEETVKSNILCSYETLTARDKMGSRFKFCSIHPASMKEIHSKYPPAGFNRI